MSDIMSFSPLWGEWYIKELIGKGTFGAVYTAEKNEYGNTYTSAVKHISIPNESMNADSLIAEGVVADEKSVMVYYDSVRDKMIKEINFCYALRGNTNIVSYEDHCIIPKADGVGYDIFIRMEHLTALPKYMRENAFGENEVIQLGIDICSALEVLDKHNIIHRDIKPANIFVNSVGVYKLGDFGESKVLSNTNVGMTVRGTYTYMSPEISMGRNANITADIYSLGIVMYRLLNGNKAPFVPVEMTAVDSQVVEAANIRRFRGEKLPLPKYCQNSRLAEVIMKACEFSPSDRWQKPRQMKKALESLLEQPKAAQTVDTQHSAEVIMPQNNAEPSSKKRGKLKIIIPVIAALIIAAAAVVTIIAVNNNKPSDDKKPEDNTSAESSRQSSEIKESSVQSSEQSENQSSVPGEASIVSLGITSMPEKTVYTKGEAFDTNGIVLEAGYSDGTKKAVPVTECEISGFDSSAAGTNTVVLSYGGKTAEFSIEVKDEDTGVLDSGSCGSSMKYTISRDGVLTISGSGKMDDYSLNYVILENNSVGIRCDHPWIDHAGEITKVVIEDGVGSVGDRAFYELSNLTEIVMPDSVASVGEGCFRGCTRLQRLDIPAGVSQIGDEAFVSCRSLREINVDSRNSTYSSSDGGLLSKDMKTMLKCPEAMEGVYNVPSGVDTIGTWAFDNCSRLTEIVLPDSLEVIEKYAFSGCKSVSVIEIPSSVTMIEASAFRYWQNTQNISFPGITSVPDSWDKGWYNDCKAECLWGGAFG